MPKPITVCAAQIAPAYMDKAATTAKIVQSIEEAARLGARLIAFPETILPGYPYWTLIHDPLRARQKFSRILYEQSVRLDDPEIADIRAAARAAQCVAVVGINEREGGTIYNSQLVIDADGSVLGCRRKLVPTHHERISWGRGDGADLRVFDTRVGRVGALVCYEHTNPLFRYAIQSQEESFHIANWPGGMPWTDALIDASVRAYAVEGASFVISVTSIVTPEIARFLGEEAAASLKMGGGASAIVAPGGHYLARSDPDREHLLCADVDLGAIADWKHIVDGNGHYARPDVLQLRINRTRQRTIETIAETTPRQEETTE